MDTIDLGNNDTSGIQRVSQPGQHVTTMTYTKSKTFKTETGARRWLARNTD
ncbi:DUF1391 family protein [Escherichia coli]